VGSRPSNAKELRSALARLTGDSGKTCAETYIFRVNAESSDGVSCPVNFQIGKTTFFNPTSLHQVADTARIDRRRVDELWDWSPDELRTWLSQYPASVLKVPRNRVRPALLEWQQENKH
jgi:hypothetical protein